MCRAVIFSVEISVFSGFTKFQVYEINTTYVTASGHTPFYLMFHRQVRPLDFNSSFQVRILKNDKNYYLLFVYISIFLKVCIPALSNPRSVYFLFVSTQVVYSKIAFQVNGNGKPTFVVRDIERYMEEREQKANDIINQVCFVSVSSHSTFFLLNSLFFQNKVINYSFILNLADIITMPKLA